MARILVINPNSNAEVTQAMSEALEPFRLPSGPLIECVTLEDAPLGIESETDRAAVVMPLLGLAESSGADAVVIACYSDPGLEVLRERLAVPVFGIGQAACATALTLANRIGVIAISDASIPRHMRLAGVMGMDTARLVERAIGLRVHELADEARTYDAMIRQGEALRDVDRAGCVILGCAGMARYRGRLQERLGLPVLDPCQCAVAMAFGRLLAA